MRILHINCNYIGTTLHQLMVEKLDALGIENEVFVPTYDRSIAVIETNNNVYVSECFKRWDRIAFDYKQSKIVKVMEEHYDIKSFDLIHAYTLFTDGNAARVLSEKYGVPYVVAVRNTDVNVFFEKMIYLRSRGVQNLCKASKVFFLSEAYRKQVFEKYIPPQFQAEIEEKTEIIPNGIDDFWFANKPNKAKAIDINNIKLVYAGCVNKNKNITATQKAMSVLRGKGISSSLSVVGKIVDEKEYKKIISDRYTTYLVAQPKEKLIDIYRANDIFVMPSIHESFGLVYAEAMSQGLPVVYSRGQGFDGQFEDGVVGFSVDSLSTEELCDKICLIVNNYDNLSHNSQKLSATFSWNKISKKYLNVYRQIMEGKNSNE